MSSLAVTSTITPSATTGTTINADASFASSHIDVDAIEEALEERLGKEFVDNILEADMSLEESPKYQAKSSTGLSLGYDESPYLETLDPNLAALLSPNSLFALP